MENQLELISRLKEKKLLDPVTLHGIHTVFLLPELTKPTTKSRNPETLHGIRTVYLLPELTKPTTKSRNPETLHGIRTVFLLPDKILVPMLCLKVKLVKLLKLFQLLLDVIELFNKSHLKLHKQSRVLDLFLLDIRVNPK